MSSPGRSQGTVSGRQTACRSAAGDSRGQGYLDTTHPEKTALRAAQSIALSGDGMGLKSEGWGRFRPDPDQLRPALGSVDILRAPQNAGIRGSSPACRCDGSA